MCGKKRIGRAPSKTPWDEKPLAELTPAELIVMQSARSIYAFRHEAYAGDADFFNGYTRDRCSRCGSEEIARAGFDRGGIQKYLCGACGRGFSPTTGTIFEDRKLPVPAWFDFILQALSFESISAMAREDRRADTTGPYWMAKLFAVLDGIQDDVVLKGKVWVDETYWPLAAKDAFVKPDGKLPRGLSRNQICIGVGVDDSGRSVCFREGLGKTNRTKTWAAFGAHIEQGAKLIHDMEGAHEILVGSLGLDSRTHNAKLLKGVPDDLNPLQPANKICFLLKSFLHAHSGFNRDDMQGYLNLFHVAMNPPSDKLEKAVGVLDRAMRCPKTIRFRDFYNVNNSSGACSG